MFGFFPRPMDDELLYSLLARYRVLSGARSSNRILEAAFGKHLKRISLDLPGCLTHLAMSLPFENCKPEWLVEQFTLFPYYIHFLPEDVARRLHSHLLSRDMVHLHQLSQSFSGFSVGDGLRFCPVCVQEDQLREGMSGWRRSHQLPGVFTCSKHNVWLRLISENKFHVRDLVVCPNDPDAGLPLAGIIRYTAAQRMAKISRWLLRHPGLPHAPRILKASMEKLIQESRWFDVRGLRASEFCDAIEDYFGVKPNDLARRLGALKTCVREHQEMWLLPRMRCRDKFALTHPIEYVVLLAVLKRKVSDLFAEREGHDAVVRVDPLRLRNRCFSPSRRFGNDEAGWKVADAVYLAEVEDAIERLRSNPARPRFRITLSLIAREAMVSSRIMNDAVRFPRTAAAARAGAEDTIAYFKRCLDWAADRIVSSNRTARWSDLVLLGRLHELEKRDYPVVEAYAHNLFAQITAAKR
jgi:hypothetical protein